LAQDDEFMSKSEFELAHIAVAAVDLEAVVGAAQAIFGAEASHLEAVPTEKVKLQFMTLGGQRFEFLEPTDPQSPISKFLAKRGGGIHHIAFYVNDIDSKLIELKTRGVMLIDETAKPGAEGCRVAFLHPKSCGGILVELIEKPLS
jgi:methylmalonyl-CoA/ethylmalonyl-CoA epimerase